VPYLKTFRELGIDVDEVSGLTRASLDGSVPKDLSFSEWFDGKGAKFQMDYLGKQKYKLYKENKLKYKELFDNRGNPLSINELNKKYS
jgi:hypothetical protein